MAERKYRFKGHESFTLREGWLSKGLCTLEKNEKLFFENSGADALGVGVNMAKAIRYWMRCAKLTVEHKTNIKLDMLGKIIWKNDPYLEQIFSLWLIHCNIVRNQKEATTWNLFFNKFDSVDFNQEYLKQEMLQMVRKLPKIDKVSERSIIDDCDTLIRMYTKQPDKEKTPEEKNASPFVVLGLIRNTNGGFVKEQPALNKIPEELVLYLILQQKNENRAIDFEEKLEVNAEKKEEEVKEGTATFIGKKEEREKHHSDYFGISIDDLLEEENSPGKILNLKRSGLIELLERLAARNMIAINRTAGLDMIYVKNSDEKSLIENCYKRLLGEDK